MFYKDKNRRFSVIHFPQVHLCLFHIFYYVHPIKEISLDDFQPFLFTNLQYVIFLRTYRLHAVGVFNIFILKQFKTVGEREKARSPMELQMS